MPKDMFESVDTLMAYIQIESCKTQLQLIHKELKVLQNATRDFVELVGGGCFISKEKKLIESAISITERMIAAKKVIDAYDETDWEPVNILKQNLAEVKQYFNPQWN